MVQFASLDWTITFGPPCMNILISKTVRLSILAVNNEIIFNLVREAGKRRKTNIAENYC